MNEPQTVVYERWWTVAPLGGDYQSQEFATPAEAAARAIELLDRGTISVTLYRTDREKRA